ncbi:MAG TPA: hypothetical protein VMY69_07065 [Phycisphaerae bacterium]|nr:hypothetical protein [Phycisphaerae bacterium]
MDGKTVVIVAMVVLALLLGGLVTTGLYQERSAYAQGGVYSTYLATTAEINDDLSNFVILDTETRRLMFYRVDVAKGELQPTSGRELLRDFQRKTP